MMKEIESDQILECTFCRQRIGESRFYFRGRWQPLNFENALALANSDPNRQESICPDCEVQSREVCLVCGAFPDPGKNICVNCEDKLASEGRQIKIDFQQKHLKQFHPSELL